MKKEEIEEYLQQLNNELASMDIKGELCLYGGAVMCLVYNARPSTKDVDAVFMPAAQIRQAVKQVAESNHLKDNWLNDAVKGFLTEHRKNVYLDLSHLKIYVPDPDYLLAMKTLSSRVDGTDREDILCLAKHLKIKKAEQVFSILEKYYPQQRIKPATQYFVEELFPS